MSDEKKEDAKPAEKVKFTRELIAGQLHSTRQELAEAEALHEKSRQTIQRCIGVLQYLETALKVYEIPAAEKKPLEVK